MTTTTQTPAPHTPHDPAAEATWFAPATGVVRIGSLVLGILTTIAGAVGLYAAIAAGLGPQTAVEIVLTLAGITATLIGLRLLKGGIGISLLCVAGAVLVPAILTEPGVRFALTGAGSTYTRAGIDLADLFLVRAALGSLIALLAAWAVLQRHPAAAFANLLRAAIAAIPCIAIAAAWTIPAGRAAIMGLHPVLMGIIAAITLVLVCALVSMAVHCTIRAFETGRTAPTKAT